MLVGGDLCLYAALERREEADPVIEAALKNFLHLRDACFPDDHIWWVNSWILSLELRLKKNILRRNGVQQFHGLT